MKMKIILICLTVVLGIFTRGAAAVANQISTPVPPTSSSQAMTTLSLTTSPVTGILSSTSSITPTASSESPTMSTVSPSTSDTKVSSTASVVATSSSSSSSSTMTSTSTTKITQATSTSTFTTSSSSPATSPSTLTTSSSTPTTSSSTPTTSSSTPMTSSSTPTISPSIQTSSPSTQTLPVTTPPIPSSSASPQSSQTPQPSTSVSLSPTSTHSSSPTSSQSPATKPPLTKVSISETNIWLWKNSTKVNSWFVELKGKADVSLEGLSLVIRDATNFEDGIQLKLTDKLDVNGFYVVTTGNGTLEFEDKLRTIKGILLYLQPNQDNTKSLENVQDFLLYGINPEPAFNSAYSEKFLADKSKLIVNMDSFTTEDTPSFSRCKAGEEGFVLVPQTIGTPNNCDLDEIQPLEMKLTRKVAKCDSTKLPSSDKLRVFLLNQIITGVNVKRQCGLSPSMFPEFKVSPKCTDKTTEEIPVTFTVHAAFKNQLTVIEDGYRSFVLETRTITVNNWKYDVMNCTESCFIHATPSPSSDDDGQIKVTVAAVLSCIGVFLVVLVCVIIYMKRKRRGILQFRMTRLDEDDDDLIGDMDDFVGNQGATFSSFK